MPNWTEEQKQVIRLGNRNLLVSAAAGSGKTATLVERIITMITRKENPVDIDRILVVTFTRAAAAEMRERIGAAIEKKLEEEPQDVHLQRQALLLHSASITTIDSFCLNVIQNYFHEINLDPVFRVADEEELTLLQHETVTEVLEEAYTKGDEDFLSFAECYGGKHQDDRLEEYILRLYRFAQSCPWPEAWLEEKLACSEMEAAGKADDGEYERLEKMVRVYVEECLLINQKALAVCAEPDGPGQYTQALEDDREWLRELHGCRVEELFARIPEISFTALSRKANKECTEEKKERVKALREKVKDSIKRLQQDFFFQSMEEMQSDKQKAAAVSGVLLRLTLRFLQAFAKHKQDKRLVDFSDIEHFALDILTERTKDSYRARAAALELRAQYSEIMIDEYQDSNEVQEVILRSVSREEEGTPNIFMVGDVKQSIYRFRLAKPELFLEKYNSYTLDESKQQRIDLHKNFRSRKQVLDSVNELFFKLMGEKIGGIEYDEDAALYAGADYLVLPGQEEANDTEVLLLAEEGEKVTQAAEAESEPEEAESLSDEEEAEAEYSNREKEALLCAAKIRSLTGGGIRLQEVIRDSEGNETKSLRPCRYGDIVLLMRTMSGWADIFARVLSEQGIPVISDTQNGYFNVPEIKWLLNYLRCLDNPRQDVAFAGVLFSPFAALTTNEAAVVRAHARKQCLYDAVLQYSSSNENPLADKLQSFLKTFHELRVRGRILTVTELIREIFAKTGYEYYVLAMPAGEQRAENLGMFLAKAAAFEKSSYRGLAQFIRYVERLIRYEVDYGEAVTGDGSGNAVRIMSIHRSKGLEFPVVFVCGMAKSFNFADMREKIIFHPEQGIALDYIDEEKRTIVPTLKKKLMANQMTEEMLGEELRLLYVAMTRAKEKLYLTGYVGDAEQCLKKWKVNEVPEGEKLLYTTLRQAGCFFDFVGPVLDEAEHIRLRVISTEQLKQLQHEEEGRRISRREFLACENNDGYQPELWQQIQDYLNFTYAYDDEKNLPIKTSVSEIKKRAFAEDEFDVPLLIEEQAGESLTEEASKEQWQGTLPEFLKEKEGLKGTDRGTLYHKALELLPLTDKPDTATIKAELAKLVQEGRLTDREGEQLSAEKLCSFYRSPLARRMYEADKAGRLYREQPFVLAVPAHEIYEIKSTEPILIQGIIDVFFEEADGLVLLDYKTDRVPVRPEETLLRRYKKQLEFYARALTEITGTTVKEAWLYSFYLQREILVPLQ